MLNQAQVYIEKHKITALFEDLMNKLVRNAPENPIIYLIKQLYKKAGLDIPFELKSMAELKKDSINLTIVGHSSEIVSKSVALASWSGKPGEPHSTPFLRREKSLSKSWQTPKEKALGEVHFNKKIKPVKGQKSEDKKEKTGWNSLTKITNSTFDEFANQTKGSPSKTTKAELVPKMKDVLKSWGLDNHMEANNNRETNHYISLVSPKYMHTKKKLNENDLIADELPSTPSLKSYRSQKSVDTLNNSTHSSRRQNCKVFKTQKHKAELERLIMQENQITSPAPSLIYEDEEIDGAIDLLENPSDLESEGVSSLSSAGFKLSKTLRQREDSQVKLNIRLYPNASDLESMTSQSNCFRDHRRHIDQESLATSYKYDGSDEDIESASQVSAHIKRRYHWNSPDSEEDYAHSPTSKPHVANKIMSKSLNGLQISQNFLVDNSLNPKPNSSVPLPATSPLAIFSKKSKKHELSQEDSQHSLNREQLQKLKTTSYGWNIPESDTSILSSHSNRF